MALEMLQRGQLNLEVVALKTSWAHCAGQNLDLGMESSQFQIEMPCIVQTRGCRDIQGV